MNTPPTTPKRKRPGSSSTAVFNHGKHAPVADTGANLETKEEQVPALKNQHDLSSQLSQGASTPNPGSILGTPDGQEQNAACPSPRAQMASSLGKLNLCDPNAATSESNLLLDRLDRAQKSSLLDVDDDGNEDSIVDDTGLSPSSHKKMRLQYKKLGGNGFPESSNQCTSASAMRQMTPPPEHIAIAQALSSEQKHYPGCDEGITESSSFAAFDDRIDGLPKSITAKSKVNSLTWHDSEITGHLGLDPEDDGTGINGIGFRPSAQQSYARSMRRKQQLRDCREREGREERKRRYDRRALATDETINAEGELSQPKRVVRFA